MSTDRRTILFLCPSAWDRVQLAASRTLPRHRYDLRFVAEEAEDYPAQFDALGFIDQMVRACRASPVDGVATSSDYPGAIVAAAIAQEVGLVAPTPQAVLRCSHKYYSRLAQREAVPEATPRFALVRPGHLSPQELGLDYPLFIKPVKSWFSILATRMENEAQLAAFLQSPQVRQHLTEFVGPFNRLVRRYTDFAYDGSYLIAEELLRGSQVTVEGYVFCGEVTILGVVDSVMFPGTISFQRFEYPSSLPASVQARMGRIAARVMRHIGFDNGLFNIEMFYDAARDAIRIIEINPRMCGQFADLMESVNGTNTYEILLSIACGERPQPRRGQGRFAIAASFPLREFRDKRVTRVPTDDDIARVKEELPVTLVKRYYREGQRLSDVPDNSDGLTWRHAVINMAGYDRASLLRDFDEALRRLRFGLADV